jgi:hypothetical protein
MVMKKYLATTAIAGCLLAVPAYADPTFMLGVTTSFGGSVPGQVGISARILSDNSNDSFTGVAGVTYFPTSNNWGLDAGIGYNFNKNTTAAMSYDFLNNGVQLSAGWADLEVVEEDPASS